MRLELTHDPEIDAWTLRHFDVSIRNEADIERWQELLEQEVAHLGGQRVYLLISMDGFSLDPAVVDAYGRVAKRVMSEHTVSVIRYGRETDMTTTAVRLGAVLNRFPSNIFPDRQHALAALEQIRRLPASP